jgi:hypothetical protein
MNLRHLKLWKRHAAGGSSGGGNDVTNDVVVVRTAPLVEYDVRSPSSDSGYSDVVPASMSVAASTTASFGTRHHHHQQQQPPQQRRIVQLPPPSSSVIPCCLGPELPAVTAGGVARSGASAGVAAGPQMSGKRAATDATSSGGMFRISETSTTTAMTPGNVDSRKHAAASGRSGVFTAHPAAAKSMAATKVATPGGRTAEPVTMDTLIGFVRSKDVERLKRALSETKFDVNTRDSVGFHTAFYSVCDSLTISNVKHD